MEYKISEFKLILLILRIRGNLPYQQTTNYYLLFYRARYPTKAISLSHAEISKQWREVENCKPSDATWEKWLRPPRFFRQLNQGRERTFEINVAVQDAPSLRH